MRKFLTVLFVILAVIYLGYTITTTINPYYLLLKDLAGDKIKIFLLIKPGINPHLFSPKVSDAKVMDSSVLLVANGLGFEPYIKKSDKVLYVSDFIPELFIVDNNPHIWLDPFFAKYYIIPGITKELIALDPENEFYYLKRAKLIIEKLEDIIKELYQFFEKFRGSKVLVEHPSFYYFFDEFGIKSVALESGHGKEIPLRKIKEILNKEKGLKAIFGEVQQNLRTLKIIANELHMDYYVLDPIGVNAKSYVELFTNNLKIIKEAFLHEK